MVSFGLNSCSLASDDLMVIPKSVPVSLHLNKKPLFSRVPATISLTASVTSNSSHAGTSVLSHSVMELEEIAGFVSQATVFSSHSFVTVYRYALGHGAKGSATGSCHLKGIRRKFCSCYTGIRRNRWKFKSHVHAWGRVSSTIIPSEFQCVGTSKVFQFVSGLAYNIRICTPLITFKTVLQHLFDCSWPHGKHQACTYKHYQKLYFLHLIPP